MHNEIKIEPTRYKNEDRLKLIFSYDKKIIDKVKTIPGRRWSKGMRCWHIPYEKGCIQRINTFLNTGEYKNEFAYGNQKKAILKKDYSAEILLYKQIMELRKLSNSTQKTYEYYFREFTMHYFSKEIRELDYYDIAAYIKKRCEDAPMVKSRQVIASVKFYYERVLGREKMFFNLKKAKKLERIPTHIDFIRIRKIIESINPVSDKLLLYVTYYLNLTPQQIVHL
jgi:hypothetical protein